MDLTTLTENKVTVTLYRSEILRHVQDNAWLMGKSTAAKSENPEHDDEYLMDVFKQTFNGDGNDEVATRYMTNAFNYCVTFFRKYLYDYITADKSVSDAFSRPTSYNIVMYVADAHLSDVDFLAAQIHNLIAAEVLYNWCTIVAPEYLDRIAAMKEEAEGRLQEQRWMFTNRNRPERRS